MDAKYFLLYVDDKLLISKEKSKIARMKKMLCSKFKMKDLGLARRILGMKIDSDRVEKNALLLSQKGYLEKIIDIYSMRNAKLQNYL